MAGHRTALVVRAAGGDGAAGVSASARRPAVVLGDGTRRALDPGDPPLPIGAVRGRRARTGETPVLDAFWCAAAGARARSPACAAASRTGAPSALALLLPGGAADLVEALDDLRPRVVGSEADAARRGAATTPGAGERRRSCSTSAAARSTCTPARRWWPRAPASS